MLSGGTCGLSRLLKAFPCLLRPHASWSIMQLYNDYTSRSNMANPGGAGSCPMRRGLENRHGYDRPTTICWMVVILLGIVQQIAERCVARVRSVSGLSSVSEL